MTGMKTMTLTEFLLARIADDEAEARAWEASWGKCWDCEGTGGYGVDEFDPPRVLAECEAKRRIVEQWRVYADAQYPDYAGGYASAMDDVLQLLALPYADHPDYREEWRA